MFVLGASAIDAVASQPVLLVSQDRSVRAIGRARDAEDHQEGTATGFGPFVSSVSAHAVATDWGADLRQSTLARRSFRGAEHAACP